MTKEKEDYLFNTFPNLFPDGREADVKRSLMSFGFPGDGWYNIIKDLCEKITATGVKVEVVQVKEKFGTLRYYIDFAEGTSQVDIRRVFDLIGAIEDLSETTCEHCGAPGTLKTDGWWRTLCDACEIAQKAERNKREEEWSRIDIDPS